MEGHLQKSPELGYPIESGDAKYVSGLSTILVATIQEAKDRISQIEYIFCSQLFPNFQSKSKIMQKIYSEARKAAEEEWKEKENELLLEIKKLQAERQHTLEENQSMKSEMTAGPSMAKEENSNQHLPKQSSLEKKVGELEQELRMRSKEVNEGMVLQNKLLQLVQSKSCVLVDKGKELKENEKKKNVLVAEVKGLDKKVEELQQQLKRKSDEVENLEKYINELQEDFRRKMEEADERKKFQQQLVQQIDVKNSEMLKNERQTKESEEERKLLLEKVRSLEKEVEKLQVDLNEGSTKMAGGVESYKNLLQCIELKDTELASEKNKRKDLTAAYKRLKSQYKFICSKFSITVDNTPFLDKIEEEKDSLRHSLHSATLSDHENQNQDTSTRACNTNTLNKKVNIHEMKDNERGSKIAQTSSSHYPSSISPNASKRPAEAKSAPLAGAKRHASHWRETRSHQHQDRPDPHDDFLDTPLENIKGNLKKAIKEVVHDLPVLVPKDMKFDSSDDETQDINAVLNRQKQQMQAPNSAVTRGYKFVEPVRKKAERETLKGVECNQCKKFYDAVLPNDGGIDTDGSKKNLRCEHHDGVSRHRYRYVPPLTPEGFWNIGFDSEI